MGKIARRAPRLAIVNGQITTTSRIVAETFCKRHDDVLKRIRSLDCSEEFRLRNFAAASFFAEQPNGGKAEYTEIRMTRDGFMFLTMGFTGPEAAARKEKWIDTFNAMAEKLQEKQQKRALAHTNTAQSATKSGVKKPLLLSFDPASLIGEGAPEVPDWVELDAELLEALNSRAVSLAGECVPALRSYLRRAMVHQATVGSQPPRLNKAWALAALKTAGLAESLAYERSRSLALVKKAAANLTAELARSAKAIEDMPG